MNVTKAIESAGNLAMVGVLGIGLYAFVLHPSAGPAQVARPKLAIPKAPLSLASLNIDGNATTARAGLIMFSDFQCPFCARFALDTLPKLQPYVISGRLLIGFRNLPIASHPFAKRAAAVAWCSSAMTSEPGMFWEAHDYFFAHQKEINDDMLTRLEAQRQKCLVQNTVNTAIESDIAMATELGVKGTPAFFIGRLKPMPFSLEVTAAIDGSRPIEEFKQAIDAILK